MSLPGKLCIGILEEDNPLKSYFRFKPLLVEENGKYTPYAEPQAYPEDGCIRIVPDKNESYHFKARMRRIGLFAVVDLREHPDANDKIRANKNYHEGGAEQNAFIIYSDVVREPAPEMIFEIVPEGMPQLVRPAPHTAEVLQRGAELMSERYAWESVEGAEGQARLTPVDKRCALEELQVFDIPGFREETLSFAIVPPARMAAISDMPEHRQAEKPHPHGEAPEPEKPAEKPAERREPESATKPAPEPVEAAELPGEKPWIHHDRSMMPQPVDPRLSPSQRILAAQSGMNPRRGRSLQELIDEKWQRSRLNQLGQPVAPIVTGAPVASPVDSAVSAVKDVWSQPALRRDLLESLGGIEEFGASLQECRAAARERDIEQHLEGLEERRLALMDELDHLNLKNTRVREALKQELRSESASDLAEALQRTKAAKEEQARFEQLAREARAAAQDARKAVDALTGEELERRLRDFALNDHMVERMAQLRGEAGAVPEAVEFQAVEAGTLADRVVERFAAAGWTLSRTEALNLCACAAISPVLLLSGPVGCGKTGTARLLAEALGWKDIGRFAAFGPGRGSLEDDARIEELDKQPGAPAMVLLDDANLHRSADPLRGLGGLDRPQWRLCVTLQDAHSGHPIAASALDKGFMVRLADRADAPWQPPTARTLESCPPVSLERLTEGANAALPEAMQARMAALRKGLAAHGATISRRALNDAWRYCALMLAWLGDEGEPMVVLDRAVAQRVLPGLLASAPLEALAALPGLLEGLPVSKSLLEQPLPVMI